MVGAALPQILRAKEESAQFSIEKKDTSVILIWLDGGLSHIEGATRSNPVPSTTLHL